MPLGNPFTSSTAFWVALLGSALCCEAVWGLTNPLILTGSAVLLYGGFTYKTRKPDESLIESKRISWLSLTRNVALAVRSPTFRFFPSKLGNRRTQRVKKSALI